MGINVFARECGRRHFPNVQLQSNSSSSKRASLSPNLYITGLKTGNFTRTLSGCYNFLCKRIRTVNTQRVSIPNWWKAYCIRDLNLFYTRLKKVNRLTYKARRGARCPKDIPPILFVGGNLKNVIEYIVRSDAERAKQTFRQGHQQLVRSTWILLGLNMSNQISLTRWRRHW